MKDKNFWLYAMGRFVSLVGTGVDDIAIPLFILDLTKSGTIMGTFMIIAMVPRLILYPLAGVVGDRLNRKKIMVYMDFGRGAVLLLFGVLAVRNLITIPLLFLGAFVISIMNALFGPATIAMLPDIVKEEDLTRANSVLGAFDSVSYIVGPALGGIIFGVGGIKAAFLIDGVSFVGSAVSEIFIRYEQKTKNLGKVKEIVSDLKEGLLFVKTNRGLLTLAVFALLINFLATPIFVVLLPYVLRVVIQFSAEQFGILQTSFMAGVLIGNIIIGTILARSKVEVMLKRGLLLQSGFMFVFAALIFPRTVEGLGYAGWTLFSVLFITFVFMGLFNAFVNTPLNVELQKLTPTEFRARVFSVLEVTAQGVVPIGFGIVGILLDIAPAHVVNLCVTTFTFLVVSLFVFKYSKRVFTAFESNRNSKASLNI